MKNKVFSSILAFAMTVSFVSAAGQTVLAADDGGDGLPSVTFTHGYYHDESEWAPAAEMRKIYQEFADMHKDEFTFNIVADQGGAEVIYYLYSRLFFK